jgi:NLE (NUC135) domain
VTNHFFNSKTGMTAQVAHAEAFRSGDHTDGEQPLHDTATSSNELLSTAPTSSAAAAIGGIGWAGSLVGSHNPENLGYRYSTPSKRYRAADSGNEGNDKSSKSVSLPSNVQITLRNRAGDALMETILDVPTNSTVDDLTSLVHALQAKDDGDDANHKVPYSFYVKIQKNSKDVEGDDVEIVVSIRDLLEQYHQHVNSENTLEIST